MRHRMKNKKFGRTSSHRKAMFKNMSASLINYELIKTTLPKAKELRTIIEPLMTLSKREYKLRNELDVNSNEFKSQSVALRRQAFDFLRNKAAVTKLFEEFGAPYAESSGGYTRVLKCGFRFADKAPMAYIELVDRASTDYDAAEEE